MNVSCALAINGEHIDLLAVEFGIQIDLWEKQLVRQVILHCVLSPAQAMLPLHVALIIERPYKAHCVTTPQFAVSGPLLLPISQNAPHASQFLRFRFL